LSNQIMDPVGYAQQYANTVAGSWRNLLSSSNSVSETLTGEGQAALSVGAAGLKGLNTVINKYLPGNSAPLQAQIDSDPVLNYQPSSNAGKSWRDLLGAVTAPIGDLTNVIKSGVTAVAGTSAANVAGDLA